MKFIINCLYFNGWEESFFHLLHWKCLALYEGKLVDNEIHHSDRNRLWQFVMRFHKHIYPCVSYLRILHRDGSNELLQRSWVIRNSVDLLHQVLLFWMIASSLQHKLNRELESTRNYLCNFFPPSITAWPILLPQWAPNEWPTIWNFSIFKWPFLNASRRIGPTNLHSLKLKSKLISTSKEFIHVATGNGKNHSPGLSYTKLLYNFLQQFYPNRVELRSIRLEYRSCVGWQQHSVAFDFLPSREHKVLLVFWHHNEDP